MTTHAHLWFLPLSIKRIDFPTIINENLKYANLIFKSLKNSDKWSFCKDQIRSCYLRIHFKSDCKRYGNECVAYVYESLQMGLPLMAGCTLLDVWKQRQSMIGDV